MSLFHLNDFGVELNTIRAAIVVGLFSIIYFIYKRYRHANQYQNIEDNALLIAKLKAARLKQQEIYSNTVKEQIETKQNKQSNETNDLQKTHRDNNSSTNKNQKPFSREYFPLMNGSSGSSHYRPTRKRPCGPCGGGGCQ